MGDYHIRMQVDLAAEPDTLRDALTSQDGIRSWWSTHADLDPKSGRLEVAFPDRPGPFQFDVREADGQVDWVTGDVPAVVGRHDGPLDVRAEPGRRRDAAAVRASGLRPGEPGHPDRDAGVGLYPAAAQGARRDG